MLNEENVKRYFWILVSMYGPHILVSIGEAVYKNWGMFDQNAEMALSRVWSAAWTIFSTFEWSHHFWVMFIALVILYFAKQE